MSRSGWYLGMGKKNLCVQLFRVYLYFVACFGETKWFIESFHV